MIPTSPYVTSDQVATMLYSLMRGNADFTAYTVLPKVNVDDFITWVCAEVDMKFQQAGYYVPFQLLTGDTDWPLYQTYYLQLLVVLGVASLISIPLKPAPATGPGRYGSAENTMKTLYDQKLAEIFSTSTGFARTTLGWRALYRNDTPASRLLMAESRPKTDFGEGKMDTTRYMTMKEYTKLMNKVRGVIGLENPTWDYMFEAQMGYGKV